MVTAATVAEGRQNDWQESINALNERVDAFAAWLHARREQRIAVVGHGDFWQASISFSFPPPFFFSSNASPVWDTAISGMAQCSKVLVYCFLYRKYTGALTFQHFFRALTRRVYGHIFENI